MYGSDRGSGFQRRRVGGVGGFAPASAAGRGFGIIGAAGDLDGPDERLNTDDVGIQAGSGKTQLGIAQAVESPDDTG